MYEHPSWARAFQLGRQWPSSLEQESFPIFYELEELMAAMEWREANLLLNFLTSEVSSDEKIKSIKDRLWNYNNSRRDSIWIKYDNHGFDIIGINTKTKTFFDPEGFDIDGYNNKLFSRKSIHKITNTNFDTDGFDESGHDLFGFNRTGIHRDTCTGMDSAGFRVDGYNGNNIDRDGYDREGFNNLVIHKITGTVFAPNGFNRDGFNKFKLDQFGNNSDGFDTRGIHKITGGFYNLDGFDINGIDVNNFSKSGVNAITSTKFSPEGYDQYGYNLRGFNKLGTHRTTNTQYDPAGFASDGFNSDGIHITTSTIYCPDGFKRNGYDRHGFNKIGLHIQTSTIYNPEGYDRDGFNQEGFDIKGFVSKSKWFEIIRSIINSFQPRTPHSWDATSEYEGINFEDEQLAMLWSRGERNDSYTLARMLSARVAEKVAFKFYSSLGFDVEDISIKQLAKKAENSSSEWQLCDLRLNNNVSIDIKNARTSLDSSSRYCEHCVPKFKKDRNNNNIIIIGILSPYCKLENIGAISDDESDIYSESTTPNPGKSSLSISVSSKLRNIIYLGETNLSHISKLQHWFSKPIIQMRFDGINLIPSWCFDFPEKYYMNRNTSCELFRNIRIQNLPLLNECSEINPLPIYFFCGIELPEIWSRDLKDWQVDFYRRLKTPTTLPILFLAILVHFFEQAIDKSTWNDFNPLDYHRLLYCDSSERKYPLGILDPLNIIDDFIETISILWRFREKIHLDEFELFKFNGIGLLEGKRYQENRYETILAYCGGFIKGIGKCGNSPLIVVQNDTCVECRKLICEKCGYCSQQCSECGPRMLEAIQTKRPHG